MASEDCPLVTLANGVRMPQLGLGVMLINEREQIETAISKALAIGYRAFDTAPVYGNEEGVGQIVKASGIKREEVFLTSKLPNSQHAYGDALKAFNLSMKKLKVDYLDLYLIHWPVPKYDRYCEAWTALEKLYRDGFVRAIGVSNFHEHHLRKIFEMCEIKPMVNQLECNPYLTIEPLRSFCHENGIWPEAWFPLGGPLNGGPPNNLLADQTINSLSKKYGKTPAQVVLRWEIQENVITIPKSSNPSHLEENFSIFDFTICEEDMVLISSLNCDRRVGPHPDKCEDLF